MAKKLIKKEGSWGPEITKAPAGPPMPKPTIRPKPASKPTVPPRKPLPEGITETRFPHPAAPPRKPLPEGITETRFPHPAAPPKEVSIAKRTLGKRARLPKILPKSPKKK